MKAFWWFKDQSIAGMARPGFNATHWTELEFDEGILFGWIGQYSSGAANLESFRHHLRDYAPRVVRYLGLDEKSSMLQLESLATPEGMISVLERLASRTSAIEAFRVEGDHLHFSVSERRLKLEADFLKNHGIRRIISLTEKAHNHDFLSEDFDLHHLAIEDLGAPHLEQALELGQIVKTARQNNEKIAVHCLAGIGRTSTMLLAAHLTLGESFSDLEKLILKQNPSFILAGSQAEFIRSLCK